MVDRSTMTVADIEPFTEWLEERNNKLLPLKNEYEVMRWKNKLPTKGMPIIFRTDKTEATGYLTLNKEASKIFRNYQRSVR